MRVPCAEFRAILAPAFAPCIEFGSACKTARWAPAAGQVPRGFIGATGSLADVKLVLLLAEPGGGFTDESYPATVSPEQYIRAVVTTAYDALSRKRTAFHANLRYVLDQCWPGHDLDEQLRKTWITETYLCSAEFSAGNVPPLAEQALREHLPREAVRNPPRSPDNRVGRKGTAPGSSQGSGHIGVRRGTARREPTWRAAFVGCRGGRSPTTTWTGTRARIAHAASAVFDGKWGPVPLTAAQLAQINA